MRTLVKNLSFCACFIFVLLAGRDHSSLADTFPDPVGRHLAGLAVLLGFGHGVCGRGGFIIWHQVAVVRDEVSSQFVKVLCGLRQVELDATEDVDQSLQLDKKVMSLWRH